MHRPQADLDARRLNIRRLTTLGRSLSWLQEPNVSSNYHPVCFNRCVRALQDADKPHPPLVVEEDRGLKLRNGLISKAGQAGPPAA